MKKIFLIEPNPYHNEVLPGIVYYFEKLGYYTDVYVREEIFQDNAFCRYDFNETRNAYRFDEAKRILSGALIEEYDFVFFSSMEHCENGNVKRFLSEVGFIPKTKYGVLGIYHTSTLIDQFADYELLNQGRLFCLSNFQCRGKNLFSLAPIYFGNIKRNRGLGVKRKILCVGSSVDFKLLNKAWYSLDRKVRNRLEICHIGAKVKNRPVIYKCAKEIYHFARGLINKRYKSQSYLNVCGRLSFSEMYEKVMDSDFLLSLITPQNKAFNHFFTSCTSGLKQLALGFEKPLIVHDDLMTLWEINKEACLSYTKNSLAVALRTAAEMTESDYEKMKKNMTQATIFIKKQSLDNLAGRIAKIKITSK